MAAAIDSSTGLMQVTPWAVVLDGDFTRNLWIAGAGTAGLNAARLALAGLVDNPGTTQHTLGDMLGELDPDLLVAGLGGRWLAADGYVKQHAACSYTHPAVDLVLALRAAGSWDVADVSTVEVRVHSLARLLLQRHPRNRLSAMFSLPFVVSTAVVSGAVDPVTMQPGPPAFLAAEEFSARVEVHVVERLDTHLPDLRCTEIRLELEDGGFLALGAPNPVGDAHHFPLDAGQISAKLVRLIGAADTEEIVGAVARLAGASDVRPVLAALELDRRAGAGVPASADLTRTPSP